MTTRYSKTTGTFYPLDINYGANLPADVVEVSKTDFEAAMARPSGNTFGFVAGTLVITAPAPLTAAQLIVQANSEINAQIDAIERATLQNRGSREGWIAMMLQQATASSATEAQLLEPATGNPFYRKLKATDAEIRALRSQLK
jgi:hypothetical protein